MRDLLNFYRLSGATFSDWIKTLYLFIEPILDNKMSIFEEYGAFKKKSILKWKNLLPLGANSFLLE